MGLLLAIAALFLGWYALRRARRTEFLDAKVRALESEVASLRGRIGALERGTPAAPVESIASTEPASVPSVPEVPSVASVPSLPEPVETPPGAEHREQPAPEDSADFAPATPEPEPPSSFAPQIDWERWLGVRGAAVLGGVVLALAGIFLFRYSIEHGFFPPWLRVVAGMISGVASIVVAERFLRREYSGTADAVEGAGVVILYASTWAARVLYGLIGTPAAFVAMVAITVVCCVLSWRHVSLVIALLGLSGGFATPFLLASQADNPIGLFAYVFGLDLALLYLARRRDWPLLGLLSLLATAAYQLSWIVGRMQPHNAALGLAVLAISAAVFAFAGRGAQEGEERREWLATQIAGVLLPFAFILYFASSAPLAPRLLPLALLVLLLAIGSCWLAAVLRQAWLGLAAAVASVAVVGVWLAAHQVGVGLAWETAVVCVVLAGVFHVAVELGERGWLPGVLGRESDPAGIAGPTELRADDAAEAVVTQVAPRTAEAAATQVAPESVVPFWATAAPAAMVANLGFFWIALMACDARGGEVAPWPWIASWLALAAMLLRHAALPQRAWLQMVAAIALAIGLSNAALFLEPRTSWAVLLAVALTFQALALFRREDLRPWADHSAAVFALVAMLGVSRDAAGTADLALWGVALGLVLSLLIALAGLRLRRGEWLLAAVLLGAFSQYDWFARAASVPEQPVLLLLVEMIGVAMHAALPFAVGARMVRDPWAWPAAALAGPAWFLTLRHLFLQGFGAEAIGLLPVALGAISAAQGWRARALWPVGDAGRASNAVWFFAAAIGFVTLAIPLQLEKSWITIGWALEGVGLILLWRRFDVVWLKYVGLALLVSVTVRLIANPAVLGYYPRPAWRIVNWLLYTYLVPAAAMLFSATVLRELEIARARPWEARWYARGRPLGAVILGFAGMLAIFVWINLAIADWFSAGVSLEVSLERMPARDLAMSICWALYALLLLATGVRLRSVGVRWVSLGLMVVTIAKVFLYDLGELRDLYRVASLLGLALSLIAVSLAYQRFVLRPRT